MDSGRARQRPRTTRSIDIAGTLFELNQEQYAYFVGVWEYKLNNGNDWFLMRMPAPDDVNLTLSEVRFAQDFQASHATYANWNISSAIEFRKAARIPESILDFEIIYDGDEEALHEDAEAITAEVAHFHNLHPF